jgi:hypothetical protein
MCTADEVANRFQAHLSRPFNLHGPTHEPQSFQTVRKKSSRDRDLTVFYWPFKNGLPFNQTASNIFKMQIYGDVILVQQTKEPCILNRERYVNYYNHMYIEQFTKRKRESEPQTLSTDDYELAKAQMTSELQGVEQLASASASVPAELAKAAVLPPPSGKEIADLLRQKGQHPEKRHCKQPVAVEVAA